ncbi:MAG: substrate-binding domain-containing protein, partial [Verrucomicrobiota bacterium]
ANAVPSVFFNYRAGGRMAAEHLISRGFQNLGYLGWTRDVVSRGELDAFRQATEDQGFSCNAHRFGRTSIEGSAPGWESFVHGLDDWIASWQLPIGVFVTQDIVGRYLINRCKANGLDVSRQIAIVGNGNEPSICEAPPPTLTSIDTSYAEVGYRAAQLLDRLMDGEAAPEGPEFVPPRGLIPRQSTDSFAADDPLVARALRFIAEHGHEGKMQVNDVAKAVGVNRRTLERKFSESLDQSIAGEIARLRIERAKRRLVQTDEQLKMIAKDCGFESPDRFSKVFLRLEGVSPRQYREQRTRR